MTEIAASKDNLTFISSNNIIVDEWFNTYIEIYKKGVVRPQTVAHIESMYRCHMKQLIGNKKLQSVTKEDIIQLLNNANITCNKGSVEAIRECCHAIFEQAVKTKLIKCNLVYDIKMPINSNPSNPKRELEEKELYWFFRGLQEKRSYDLLFFVLLFVTGIRQGEAIALKWSNISPDFSSLKIECTYVRYYENHKKVEFENAPKSKTSIRELPIQKEVGEMLKEHKETAKFIAKQYGKDFSEGEHVFLKVRQHVRYDHAYCTSIYKSVRKYLKEQYNIDADSFSSHYFRHTFVTKGMRENVPLETLKQLTGHSNYNMLLKYAHSNDDDKKEAINKTFG